jgi:hypothetical protein
VLVFISDARCVQEAVAMQCKAINSCSFARSGESYVIVHQMISAAREVAKLLAKF